MIVLGIIIVGLFCLGIGAVLGFLAAIKAYDLGASYVEEHPLTDVSPTVQPFEPFESGLWSDPPLDTTRFDKVVHDLPLEGMETIRGLIDWHERQADIVPIGRERTLHLWAADRAREFDPWKSLTG